MVTHVSIDTFVIDCGSVEVKVGSMGTAKVNFSGTKFMTRLPIIIFLIL